MIDIKKLRVRDLMQTRVQTIERTATLAEAARWMADNNCSSPIVLPLDDSDAYGIVTRKDILNIMVMEVHDEFVSQLGDIMTKPAITVGSALSLENCLLLMRSTGTRRLPVVDGDKLVGMISTTDIFKRLVRELG
ncbi:CBS domain-containing protein [Desulfurivibrio dismutans]|uniref:CBS domain-containing protein n=1 Tax=Desulfurivibrio dismutans TaxID=1398908 RepID=UPI0023DBAE08|nr:CBS domain-containing protein [Desulfurivibrio alkaliphilus]MDF1614446.1 CBS domain-containing protein [Desulfurivibrio alkaliphilus]